MAGDAGQHLDQLTAPEYTSFLFMTRADRVAAPWPPSDTTQCHRPSGYKEVCMIDVFPTAESIRRRALAQSGGAGGSASAIDLHSGGPGRR